MRLLHPETDSPEHRAASSPVDDRGNNGFLRTFVFFRIERAEVGYVSQILVFLGHKDQPVMRVLVEETPRHRESEFERHVEACEAFASFASAPGQVVDRVARTEHRPANAVDPRIGNRTRVDCAPRGKPASYGCEKNRIEQRLELTVVRTVNKD